MYFESIVTVAMTMLVYVVTIIGHGGKDLMQEENIDNAS